ncbi:large ribosomal subunit protein uL14m isoform X1 [Symphalangus syndactylus]|uniref:large ribosomal subunit protein uL14m isoform X1 n=2 Tax=Hylobatidae TaxID=9577 RepID=UPI002441ED0C|nr:39S ribosomal protein L14, mitochondrial isoform X1 [Symphalangus syndactylus]
MQLACQEYTVKTKVDLLHGGYGVRRKTVHSSSLEILYVLLKNKDFIEDLSWDPMAFFTGLWGPFTCVSRALSHRCFSTTGSLSAIQKMTRVRVVDNSALGNSPYHRAPRCIHVYNKNGVGKVGDRILLAIKGQKKKALIVGHCMPGPRMTPRFDSNNVVLIEDNGNPVGTRIKTPIPTCLRKREGEYSKVLAIAQNFV